MAFKLPSFNLLRRKTINIRPTGIAGSKATGAMGDKLTLNPNGRINQGSLPKGTATQNMKINRTGVTKTFATRGAARRAVRPPGLLSRLTKPKLIQPLRPAGKRTFGQMINKQPKFGSMSKTPRTGESFGAYNKRVK